jgi:hypothetical protein
MGELIHLFFYRFDDVLVRMSYIHDPDAPGEIDVVEFPSTSSIVAPLALSQRSALH